MSQNPTAPGEARPQRSNEADLDTQAKDHKTSPVQPPARSRSGQREEPGKPGLCSSAQQEGASARKESAGRGLFLMVDRTALGDRLGTVPSELALTPRRVLEVSSLGALIHLAVCTSREVHPCTAAFLTAVSASVAADICAGQAAALWPAAGACTAAGPTAGPCDSGSHSSSSGSLSWPPCSCWGSGPGPPAGVPSRLPVSALCSWRIPGQACAMKSPPMRAPP